MSKQRRPLAGILLIVASAALWATIAGSTESAGATSTRRDHWITQRTTTLMDAAGRRERQLATLIRATRQQGSTHRLRRAVLIRQASILRLARATTRLNRVVLEDDHGARDPVLRRVVRLNRRVCRLASRSVRLTRASKVAPRRQRSRRLTAARAQLLEQIVELRRLQKASAARDPAPLPSTAQTPVSTTQQTSGPPDRPPATGATITDLVLSQGQSGITYQGVRFVSSRRFQQATVTITRAHHITFRDCVFEGSAWNNITINDTGGTVHDISFVNCYVKSAPRMGFECTSRGPDDACYTDIVLDGVTFEPQGSEAISFDGPPVHAHCTVRHVLIKGSGTRPDLFPWGQGMEINGPRGFLVEHLTMHRTRGSNWNLSGADRHMDWTFRDIRIDNTVNHLGGIRRSDDANIICAFDVDGSVWRRCTFRNARPGAALAYLSDCDDNRFDGIGRSGTPTHITEVNGCSGNIW